LALTPRTATRTKVLSPTVEQDLNARGVAQVIVVLHQDVGADSADSAAARTVQSCFRLSERSQSSAVRKSLVTGGGLAAARLLEGRAYRQSWANELHPSKKGFQAVAAEFSKVILALD